MARLNWSSRPHLRRFKVGNWQDSGQPDSSSGWSQSEDPELVLTPPILAHTWKFDHVCMCVYVCGGVFVWARVRVHMHVLVVLLGALCMYFRHALLLSLVLNYYFFR